MCFCCRSQGGCSFLFFFPSVSLQADQNCIVCESEPLLREWNFQKHLANWLKIHKKNIHKSRSWLIHCRHFRCKFYSIWSKETNEKQDKIKRSISFSSRWYLKTCSKAHLMDWNVAFLRNHMDFFSLCAHFVLCCRCRCCSLFRLIIHLWKDRYSMPFAFYRKISSQRKTNFLGNQKSKRCLNTCFMQWRQIKRERELEMVEQMRIIRGRRVTKNWAIFTFFSIWMWCYFMRCC